MKQFDLISGTNINIGNCGDKADILGVIDKVEGNNVHVCILWSRGIDGPTFFVGQMLEFDIQRDKLIKANELMFPYDIPGTHVYCVIREHEFKARNIDTQLMRLPRFQNLINYIKYHYTSSDMETLILDYMYDNNYAENKFLNGGKRLNT